MCGAAHVLVAIAQLSRCFLAFAEEVADSCIGPLCADDSPINDVLLLQTRVKFQGDLTNEAFDWSISEAFDKSASLREVKYALERRTNLTDAQAAALIREGMRRWGKETLGLVEEDMSEAENELIEDGEWKQATNNEVIFDAGRDNEQGERARSESTEVIFNDARMLSPQPAPDPVADAAVTEVDAVTAQNDADAALAAHVLDESGAPNTQDISATMVVAPQDTDFTVSPDTVAPDIPTFEDNMAHIWDDTLPSDFATQQAHQAAAAAAARGDGDLVGLHPHELNIPGHGRNRNGMGGYDANQFSVGGYSGAPVHYGDGYGYAGNPADMGYNHGYGHQQSHNHHHIYSPFHNPSTDQDHSSGYNQGHHSVDGNCQASAFGCCPDGKTASMYDGSNCEAAARVNCNTTKWGCCPDMVTESNMDGSSCMQGPHVSSGCYGTLYGCCGDQTTAARFDASNCRDSFGNPTGCRGTRFGCCPDGITVANANESSCNHPIELRPPDPSTPNGQAPPTVVEQMLCQVAEFGCCPDGKTPRPTKGGDCTCLASEFGCCPDGITPKPTQRGQCKGEAGELPDELKPEETVSSNFERNIGKYCSNALTGRKYTELQDCRKKSKYCSWLCADKEFRGTEQCWHLVEDKGKCGTYVERKVLKPPKGVDPRNLTQMFEPTCSNCLRMMNFLATPLYQGALCYYSFYGLQPPFPCMFCKTEMVADCEKKGGEATGAFFFAGIGYCRPPGDQCKFGDKWGRCRVNGYYKSKPSTHDNCRAVCMEDDDCIGYAMDRQLWCWIHTTADGKAPKGWEQYTYPHKEIAGGDGTVGVTCYKYQSKPPPPPLPPPKVDKRGDPIPAPSPPAGGPQFAKITSGTCTSRGLWNINSASVCVQAAKALKFNAGKAKLSDAEGPSGCYYKEGTVGEKLWFAENSNDHEATEERALLCEAQPPDFILIRKGRCEEANGGIYIGVGDKERCSQIAIALKFEKTAPIPSTEADLPSGCIYEGKTKDNKLTWNDNGGVVVANKVQALVCESTSAPPPAPACAPADGKKTDAAWFQIYSILRSSREVSAGPCPPGMVAPAPVPPSGTCVANFPSTAIHGTRGDCKSGKMQVGGSCEVKCGIGQKPSTWRHFGCKKAGEEFTLVCESASPCSIDMPDTVTFEGNVRCDSGIIQFGDTCRIKCPEDSGRIGVAAVECTKEGNHIDFQCTAEMDVAEWNPTQGANACPEGSSVIETIDECALLSKCLNRLGTVSPLSSATKPKGCFADNNNANDYASREPVKFNTHATGGTGSTAYIICKKRGTMSSCPGACYGDKPAGYCPKGNFCVNGNCQDAISVAVWDYGGTNVCPAGSETVTSEEDCRELSRCNGRNGQITVIATSSAPGGCYADTIAPNGAAVSFNTNTVGSPNGKFKICAKRVPRNEMEGYCVAEYVAGTKGTNQCPTGYRRVPNFGNCQTKAAPALGGLNGHPLRNDDPWSGGPNGCMRQGMAGDGPNQLRWYNRDCCGGGTHPGYFPMCEHSG